ncbi:TetR/AcrR family transcriptional regulator [Kitasatospora sp. NBC_01250]|uniref:TetR family transcriptional regulator n=1 Tax=Kitasatospora sp. NBC_01250 TaxID=2903571 RepID=UPI002E305146|nr:TetR family transcriptional regulator [Kitasatospora sp. NBC_01250]
MAGLRERKKEQTRQRIAAVALRLFIDHGFDSVTVNEIAEAAEVARATLFVYFPTKESLVLADVAGDDLSEVVTARPPGISFLAALRDHHRAIAARRLGQAELDSLVTQVRVIHGSPALRASAEALLYEQRQQLTRALALEYDANVAALMAAQVTASLLVLQESFFQLLLDGSSGEAASEALADQVELAFDLLEHGLARTAVTGTGASTTKNERP